MSFLLPGSTGTLQTDATSGNGTAYSLHPKVNGIRVVITGTGTISGGSIAVKEAGTESYAGTWSELKSFQATELTGGAQKVLHFAGNSGAVRVELTSIAGGGTVSAQVRAN